MYKKCVTTATLVDIDGHHWVCSSVKLIKEHACTFFVDERCEKIRVKVFTGENKTRTMFGKYYF